MFTLEGYAIRTSYGNTFDLTVNIHSDTYTFTDKDRALLKVRSCAGNTLFSAVYSGLETGKFNFKMTNEEAEKIPPGAHNWDFTVYLNATFDKDGSPESGDYVITPFQMARYVVDDIASKEGTPCQKLM